MKGRTPIPTAIKRISGDGIHDSGGRFLVDEMQPQSGPPRPPKDLSVEARKEWDRLIKELSIAAILKKSDRAALTILCNLWAQMKSAEPNMCTDSKAAAQFRDAAKLWKSYAVEFGLTPAGRVKIPAPPKEQTTTDEFNIED